jgi:hypothetical protein
LSVYHHFLGAADNVLSSIRETNEHVKEARALRAPLEAEVDYALAEKKMRRALDRLKRVAVKVIDGSEDMKSLGDSIVKVVRTLLMEIATTMEGLLSAVSTVLDLAVRVLLLSLPLSGICIRRLCLLT